MMKRIMASLAIIGLLSVGCAAVAPQTSYAVSSDQSCRKYEKPIFGIVPWYRGLLHGSDCSVELPNASSAGNKTSKSVTTFVLAIALNILQAALSVAAYVTVFFIIKGGFMYMTSTGSPDGMSSAKKTIMNAIIGLVIAVLSAAIVNAIAGAIK